jgi:hypothetical protein
VFFLEHSCFTCHSTSLCYPHIIVQKLVKKSKPSMNTNKSFQVLQQLLIGWPSVWFMCPIVLFAKNSENVLPLSSGWIIVHFFQHNYLSICNNQSPRGLWQCVAWERTDTYLVHGVETKNKLWLLNAVNVVMNITLQPTRVRDHLFETLRNVKFIQWEALPLPLGPVLVTDDIK